MGCTGSSPEARDALIASRQLHDQNKADYLKDQRKIKLLLLGAGESGKSTVLKQLRILYGGGFHADITTTRDRWRGLVHDNIVSALQELLHNVPSLDDASLQARVPDVLAWPTASFVIDADAAELIEAIWSDPATQRAWEKRAGFEGYRIQDALAYFAQHLTRIGDRDYEPTEQDILQTRLRTTGIIEEEFNIDGVPFALFDVGGQRNERRKWIHCFDGVTAVIFVAAISEYDQTLFEDRSESRITEALNLFESMCASEHFRDTPMLLFLNKSDLLREKLQRIPFRLDDGPAPRFTDYEGPNEFEPVVNYLVKKFRARNKNKRKEVYHHVTCATDTQNIRVVFSACRDIILKQNLAASGF